MKLSETTDLIEKEMSKMTDDEISFNAKMVKAVTGAYDLSKEMNKHDVRYKGKYFMLMVLNQISNQGW